MLASFKNCLLSLVRDKALLVWALAFPIIMTCIFMGMFAGIDDADSIVGSKLGVVRDANYDAALGLDNTLKAVSDPDSTNHLCDLVYYDDAAQAKDAANAGEVDAYLTVDGEGVPQLHVTHASVANNGSLSTSVLSEVLDSYLHARDSVAEVVARRPELLAGVADNAATASGASATEASPGVAANGSGTSATSGSMPPAISELVDSFTANAVKTVQLTATKNPPNAYARYYYSLLAMAAGMGSAAAMVSVRRLLPTAGPLGARQTLAAVPRWRMLTGALLGSWVCQFACLILATLFMWAVAGVNFGGDAPGVVAALAASSFVGCAAGALCGTVPKMETGMISGITCLLSLFTGMYGTASQQLADSIESAVPLLAHANPLWQTANCFYSLLYYDTPEVFLQSCLTLVVMALVFLALAAARMRRTSYDHL